MTIDKDKLRALAEAAPTGPWLAENDSLYFTDNGYTRHMLDADAGHDVEENRYYAALAFIGAANPATILALLGEIDRLESRVATEQDRVMATIGQYAPVQAERDELKAEADSKHRAYLDLFELYAERGKEADQLKAEKAALSFLLKRFVDGEHDDAEDQNERHHYHGEAQALLARMSGELQEYSLVPYETLWKQRTELVELRRDAERYRWLSKRERWAGVHADFGSGGVYSQHRVTWHAGDSWPQVEGQSMDEAVDAAMAKERSHG